MKTRFKNALNAVRNLFKRFKRSGSQPKTVLPQVNVKPMQKGFSSPLKYYSVETVIEVNGHKIGRFPLTVLAHSKSHAQLVITTKSRLIATDIAAIKTNPNGKGVQK